MIRDYLLSPVDLGALSSVREGIGKDSGIE